jgi:hypothetical protein
MRKPQKTSECRNLAQPFGRNRYVTVEIPARFSAVIGGFPRFSFGGQVQCGVAFMENNKRKPLSLPHILSTCPRVRVRAGANSGGFLLDQSKGVAAWTSHNSGTAGIYVPAEDDYPNWEQDQRTGCCQGTCNRHTPTAQKPDDDDRVVHYGHWPVVLSGGWCGEFAPKPTEA